MTKDPEMRHTQTGVAVASFTLAVDRDFKDKTTGEKGVDFIDVVAWRQTGEFVSKYFSKGRMAVVDGKLQMRKWQDKDGNNRISAEVVADNVYFGDSKKDGYTSNTYRSGVNVDGPSGFDATPSNEFAPLGDNEVLPF
jgi:single-strand DNA-binding protein